MSQLSRVSLWLLGVILVLSACSSPSGSPTSTPTPTPPLPVNTAAPTSTSSATESPPRQVNPLTLISQESIFSYLRALTSIQPYSGWRNSATEGEAEALDYVASTLGDFSYLQSLGLELERQAFSVFLATELWESRLYITTPAGERELSANALRGHRHDIQQALRFDSDGILNDWDRNPVEVSGQVVLLRTENQIKDLEAVDLQDQVVFLDYALIDPLTNGRSKSVEVVARLFDQGIAGLVLVTQFSDDPKESHGSYLGDGTPLEKVVTQSAPPVLYIRLEDLAPGGAASWGELARIETARLVWDSDVFSPGSSGNLVARIPGADPAKAVILGAHIDSPNSPGAIDNGVNSAALLEVARVLDQGHIQPAVDLYLVWFGSEELWLYGSQYFVNTHQKLLDRTIAAMLMDGITVSTDDDLLVLDGMSHNRFGDDQLPFPSYLAEKAALHNISIDEVQDYQGMMSDNGVFSAFVPQAGFAFGSPQGGYAHSPYDSLGRTRGLGDLMEQVAAVALLAGLETGIDLPDLRLTPEPDRRALIVASHTEVAHMTPATLIDFVRALAWQGFDVDVIPYGQAVSAADLADVGLVVVLPMIDYASPEGDPEMYDQAWYPAEIESLVAYVEAGGLLVLTNSANRIQFGQTFDANEDWEDANALAERFGITFEAGVLSDAVVRTWREHPLMEDKYSLTLLQGNAVPFRMRAGIILAEADGSPVVGLVDYGKQGGQVLVLGDVSILGYAGLMPPEGHNLGFFTNLARYASAR